MQKYPQGIPDSVDKYELATEASLLGKMNAKCPSADLRMPGDPCIRVSLLLHYDFRHHNSGFPPKTVTSIVNQSASQTGSSVISGLWIAWGRAPTDITLLTAVDLPLNKSSSQLGKSGQDCFAAIKSRDVDALGALFNLCSSAWRKMLPAIFEHPTIQVPVMQKLRYYQRKYAVRDALGLWRRVHLRGLLGARGRWASSAGQSEKGKETHAKRSLSRGGHGGRSPGTRLWPLSSRDVPKHFLKLF